MIVQVTGSKANKSKKGAWVIEGQRRTRFGPKHILLGITQTEPPEKGEWYDIPDEVYAMPQDSVWTKDAALIEAPGDGN